MGSSHLFLGLCLSSCTCVWQNAFLFCFKNSKETLGFPVM